jgi:hypothetical protein
MNRKLIASAMTVGALSAPVAVAIADDDTNNDAAQIPTGVTIGHDDFSQRAAVKRQALRKEIREQLKAERKAERKAARKKAAKKRAKLAKKNGGATTSTGSGGAAPPHLEAIAACESGGNPGAIGGGGAYRGKYQFDYQTWASVGGSGDPAAAPEAEQDKRAAMLYSRAGASPWPVCGS